MRKFFIYFAILLAFILVQCNENPVVTDENSGVVLLKGPGNGGGNGGGKGGGEPKDYGDLIVCLRTADGIPDYVGIFSEEHQVYSYYPQPIKYDEVTLIPVKENGSYATFELNEEGEVIPEAGYLVKEVEFGRLKLVRSPQSVLDRALQEAKKNLTQSGVTDIKTDASGRLVAIIGAEDWLVNFDDDDENDEFDDKTIDSPRENMALYQHLMTYGFSTQLSFLAQYFSPDDIISLTMGAVAAGADKTGNITVDEIAYMNGWLLDWDNIDGALGPDPKDRMYIDFDGVVYNREATYGSKYVQIKTLFPDNTWEINTVSILDAVQWTAPEKLIDYADGLNTNITGYCNGADDAVQVLEFIHSSDLIVYSPYFSP